MSDKPVSRGQRGVDAYLDGLTSRNELIPGAREYLAKRFASSNKHGGLRSLAGCLQFGDCRRYLTHEREAPARPESPLHALVRRLAPAFTSARAAEDFYNAVAIKFTPEEVDREPGRVVQDLWDMLQDKFEYRHILIDPPPLDRRTERVRAALDRLGRHLAPHADRDAIAHELRHLAEVGSVADVARAAARRLGIEVAYPEIADPDADASASSSDLRAEFARLGGYESL